MAYIYLPTGDGGKVGLDDYLASGGTVSDLVLLAKPEPLTPQFDIDEDEPEKPVEPVTPREPVNGAALLEEIRSWLATYICTVAEADLDLVTLWAAHTHLVVETYTTPRLQIDSPMPESGKTTVLEHLQRLSLRPVQMASLSSPALLTRMLNAEQRTILIDEADRSLNPDKEGIADLLAVLNSGYKRGATRPVLVPGQGGQWEVAEMPTFAAVAMAANNPNLPEDTRSRTIRVLLLPDLDGAVEESDWELIEEDAVGLHDQLAEWADQVREQVRTERPGLPDGITSRFREKWAPLKRVAAAAGGDWPDRVDAMALHDKAEYAMDREDGLVKEVPAVVLLKHIYELWPEGTTFLPTTELIDLLVIAHPTVWGDEGPFGKRLTFQRLGRMLTQGYKIHSDRPDHTGPRGYTYADFTRPWGRMKIGTPAKQTGRTGPTGPTGPTEPGRGPDGPDRPDGPITQGPLVAEPPIPGSGTAHHFVPGKETHPDDAAPQGPVLAAVADIRCRGCGDQLLNHAQRTRGMCGPCTMRESA